MILSCGLFGSLIQGMSQFGAGGPSQGEIHRERESVKLAAVRCDGVPDVGGEDEHQAWARNDLDVIAIADSGQVCIEAGIVEDQETVAGIEIVFASARMDGLSIGLGRAGIIDADQVGDVIVDHRRLSGAHAIAEEQKIELFRRRESLGFQPVFRPRDEHRSKLVDRGDGVRQIQQIQCIGVHIEPVVEVRPSFKQVAKLRIEGLGVRELECHHPRGKKGVVRDFHQPISWLSNSLPAF